MRQNNHIINRHSYQDASSFKIRQPINEHSYLVRQNIPQKYTSKENNHAINSKDHKLSSASNFYDNSRPYAHHEREQHSRELSYNSRGSNKNSIKMSDYIAQEAKNLLTNKDKFKFDGQLNKQQAHMRSSSMHCYPSNFKVTRGTNQKSFSYLNSRQPPGQPTQIPSFGIECRTTASVHNMHDNNKSYSLNKYAPTSFKLQHPSDLYHIQTRNIKTQIDQRIQRLKSSSTSIQHKQRQSRINKIDQHKLQNMDKINIKIKNILYTLQNEQDHYKKRFNQGALNHRVKTQSSAFYDHKSKHVQEDEQESLLSKYTKNQDISQSRFSRFDISRQDTFNNSYSNFGCEDVANDRGNHNINNNNNNVNINIKTALGKYCENNASSYYYYQDEQAMIKSSQSPFKSSPDRSFRKHSVDYKDASRSVSKHSKNSFDIASCKPIHANDSTKPNRLVKDQDNYSNYSQSKYPKNTGQMLSNIPECETQIIESKAYDYKNNYNNGFAEAYHTFDSRNSSVINKEFKTQSTYKDSFPHTNKQKDSQIQHLSKHNEYYFPGSSSKNKFNAKQTQTQRFMNTKNMKEELQKQYAIENASKKSNLIYFKIDEKQKYMKSSSKNYENPYAQDYQNHDDAIDEITEFTHHNLQNKNEISHKNNFQHQYKNGRNPTYLSAYDHRNYSHQMTFDNKKKDHIYSDSIKQTPRIQQHKSSHNQYQYQNKFTQNTVQHTRTNNLQPQAEDKLEEKFKQYKQKLQKYQKGMSTSKILQSQRSLNRSPNTKRDRSHSKQNSQDKYSNQGKSFRNNSNFKPTEQISNFPQNDLARTSSQNMQKLLTEIRRQREQKQMRDCEQNYKAKKNPQKKLSNTKSNNHFKTSEVQKYCRLVTTPPNYSKRQSHHFPKQDHQKFIQNLRRDRQQVAQLSQRKSRPNNGISPENERIQASNQRSQSQNSRLSSNTIVKGKNIDDQINKIQRKMQEYNQLKKDLNLDSKLNTQRTQNQQPQTREFQYPKDTNKVEIDFNNQPKRESWNRLQERHSYSESKPKPKAFSFSIDKKQKDLLKIITQDNSYVKVRNSILKEHKTNGIKSYLDDQIEKESSCSRSISDRNQVLAKSRNISSKQNIMPSTVTTIDSNKKVVLGLAQNLVLNSLNNQNHQNHEQPATKSEIKTPKLLRNLKNKLNEKCIIKKKAQKRGFRSQFINDLHEDNEIIKSAKKIEPHNLAEDDHTESTLRYSPENKQLLMKILSMIEKQILMDEKLRNEKKMLSVMTKSDKWTILMSEFIRQNPGEKRILLSQIVDIFTLSEEESNPFYSTRGVEFSLQTLVKTYGQCREKWSQFMNQISSISYDQLTSCGFSAKNLDIERKGFIEADDLTRFINMELNKYYRKRDLWLVWERIAVGNNFRKEFSTQYKLSFEQFTKGFGVAK